MTMTNDGSPASYPHAEPAQLVAGTTFEDYWRNVREGLEPLSERCIAALMGMPRIEIYRWWLMAELPDDLFEALVAARITSAKALAQIALALKLDDPFDGQGETCPHCGERLRRRSHISGATRAVILKWFRDRGAAPEFPSTEATATDGEPHHDDTTAITRTASCRPDPKPGRRSSGTIPNSPRPRSSRNFSIGRGAIKKKRTNYGPIRVTGGPPPTGDHGHPRTVP
jgi:hypothetical protein